MRALLLALVLRTCLCAGCAGTPPNMPWGEPQSDDLRSCFDFRSTRWHRLDAPPANPDVLRAMAQPRLRATRPKTHMTKIASTAHAGPGSRSSQVL